MRILGIDYGDTRVGVAVSDAMGWTAQGVGTIKNRGFDKLIAELDEIIKKYAPKKIVVGLPKNMDGSLGFRAEATYEFADKLKEIFPGEIIFWDERLTTVGASRFLNETNTRGKDRKGVIDTLSACLILEGYLNSPKNNC
ncbi:MAG: Holliday junction resolvase RuvX [Clostridiales bacterium]|nr:Holliday junction resolvase RuvX [Clostridiales bacterium]